MTDNALVQALEDAYQDVRNNREMPLEAKLSFIADKVRQLSTTFAEAVDDLVDRLQENGAGLAAPEPGAQMPDFILPDDQGQLVQLASLLEDGPVNVAFLRGHWCPYCRLNAGALAGASDKISELGAKLVAITPDRRQFSKELKSEVCADFPVLTDLDNSYALSINMAIWVGEEMKALIAGAGWDIPRYQGNDAWVLPIPAAFIIDTNGIIRTRHIDPDYRRRMDMNDLLAALKHQS